MIFFFFWVLVDFTQKIILIRIRFLILFLILNMVLAAHDDCIDIYFFLARTKTVIFENDSNVVFRRPCYCSIAMSQLITASFIEVSDVFTSIFDTNH